MQNTPRVTIDGAILKTLNRAMSSFAIYWPTLLLCSVPKERRCATGYWPTLFLCSVPKERRCATGSWRPPVRGVWPVLRSPPKCCGRPGLGIPSTVFACVGHQHKSQSIVDNYVVSSCDRLSQLGCGMYGCTRYLYCALHTHTHTRTRACVNANTRIRKHGKVADVVLAAEFPGLPRRRSLLSRCGFGCTKRRNSPKSSSRSPDAVKGIWPRHR